jgi:hypothetical protein
MSGVVVLLSMGEEGSRAALERVRPRGPSGVMLGRRRRGEAAAAAAREGSSGSSAMRTYL